MQQGILKKQTYQETIKMSVLRQLKELFPSIAEDFLKGIVDAYKEKQINIDILVELVLSFEFPPLKEGVQSVSQENSGDLTIIYDANEQSFLEAGNNLMPKKKDNMQKAENISPHDIITTSESDKETCLQYTLENTFLNELFKEEMHIFDQGTKEVNPEHLSKDNLNESEDLFMVQESEDPCNQGDAQQTCKTIFSIKKPLSGQCLPSRSTKQPLYRSCKVKHHEQSLRKELTHQSRPCNRKQLKQKKQFSSHTLSQFESTESKYTLLLKILPNANPDYLLSESQKITNQEELLIFISHSLDNEDYPRCGGKNIVRTKMMDKFECSIDEFLKEIPDPVTEFSCQNYIRTGYEENAEIYLMLRYQGLDPEVAKDHLKANNYNLTTVCAELEADGLEANPYCLDQIALHHPPSIFFHQEVWFIEHRTEIQNFLDSVVEAAKVEEDLNYRSATPTPVEEVFECEICSEEIAEYSELGTCDRPTGHLFCKTCIRRNIEIKIGEGVTTFPCLADCGGFIDLQTVKELLPVQTFTILMDKIQEEEIRLANIPGVETCPFCPYAYGPDEEELFTCLNPTCMKTSCRACRREDHSPEICPIFQNENEETARHYVESRMTEALVRQCYNCGKNFVKEQGCNKMTCPCGAKMCYLCRQPVIDYTHFNGRGGDNLDRCELYSAEIAVHDQPVAASAQKAFNELIANNPGINLDASKIIPK